MPWFASGADKLDFGVAEIGEAQVLAGHGMLQQIANDIRARPVEFRFPQKLEQCHAIHDFRRPDAYDLFSHAFSQPWQDSEVPGVPFVVPEFIGQIVWGKRQQ